uniref:Lymphocyte antigen 75 n=1 Tax=Anolis carolinensis TaxID=28377 RepID=H9GHS9_ANOCA
MLRFKRRSRNNQTYVSFLAQIDDNTFTIRHEKANKCIQVKNQQVTAEDCQETKENLWTWVSQHRLFNLGSQKCLGIDTTKSKDPLKIVDCDSDITLWWRCSDASVYSASQNKLILKNGVLTVSVDSSDAWRRNNSSDVICKLPYHEIYTRDGNSYGKPCEFPFLFNKTWHHDCIHNEMFQGGEWCSTTSSFSQHGKWGFCLKPEDGCQDTWEHDEKSGSCYQINTQAALSWKEAYVSCQRQGADLLSIRSASELNYIQGKYSSVESILGNILWAESNSSVCKVCILFLSLSPSLSKCLVRSRMCFFFNISNGNITFFLFVNLADNIISCNTKLPFICEKYNTSLLETHDPSYKPPQRKCPEKWHSFLNKCFQIVPSRDLKFKEANEYCTSFGGLLPSIRNQAEQDFITSLLPGLPQNIWIGLRLHIHSRENKWVDGSSLEYSNFHPLLQGRLRRVHLDFFDEEVNAQCGVLLNNLNSHVGTWNFTSCADINSVAICQREAAENQTQQMLNVTWNYRNVTYTALLKNLTWFDAQQECLQNNMQLVSITEQYQQAFLASQAARYNSPLWIGLSSKDDGIHYHWLDRKRISFSRWSNEDADLLDNCVYLDTDGFWKTSECYSEKPGAICYLPGKLYHESVHCPHKIKNTPWVAFRNNCYTFLITKNRMSGLRSGEGHHLCRMMNINASLLSIKDEGENNFVVEQLHAFSGLAQWLWLGLLYESDNTLRWYDDSRLSYNNWRLGRPSIKSNNFVAGISLDGFWDIYNNTENWVHLQFSLHSVLVCKIEMEPKEDKPPLPTALPYRNNTYWVLQKQLNWYDAWKECKRKGSELASIHSESEQVFMEAIVKNDGFPLWIGLTSHNGSDSDFEWSDGSAFDYKPWEYEHSLPPGNCFLLDTKGMWNRMKCTHHIDGAICYSSSNKIESKQAESSTKCPKTTGGLSQWIQYKDHCYAFDMEFYNFSTYTSDAAKDVCKKLDPSAALLTINDADENKFVTAYLRQHYFITGRVWLGMQSNGQSLKWLDGSEVIYANWAKGKENANGECSVIFSANGTWSRMDCKNVQSRVVCKAPQVTNHTGGAIAVAVLIIMVLLVGLLYYLYKKKRLQWGGFSSVRYERGIHEEETDSMFARDGD